MNNINQTYFGAGAFGSVARNRAHEEPDVDFFIVMKEMGAPVNLYIFLKVIPLSCPVLVICDAFYRPCGGVRARNLSFVYLAGALLGWGYVRLEALLSSRSVYGDRRDVEHLRQEVKLTNGSTDDLILGFVVRVLLFSLNTYFLPNSCHR